MNVCKSVVFFIFFIFNYQRLLYVDYVFLMLYYYFGYIIDGSFI